MDLRCLIYKAWVSFRKELTLTLDLYGSLLREGINPEILWVAFENGERPDNLFIDFLN